MKVEFDVEMTAGKIYDYLLKHAFSSIQGLAGGIIGVVMLVLYFITSNLLLFCIGIMAMIYLPLTLYLNATKQMKQVPAFSDKIHYIVSDRGVAIIADGKKQFQAWNHLHKVVSTGKSIIIYTDAANACILPKEDMGEGKEVVRRLIKTHMPKSRIHFDRAEVTK